MINRMAIERLYPYCLGMLVGYASWHYAALPDSSRFDSMVTAAISVTAILLGFLGTAKAMLLGFRSARFSWIKSRPIIWKRLVGYFRAALTASFSACLLSLVLLGLSITKLPNLIQPFVIPIWIGVFVISVATFYRVVSVFFSLLQAE